METIETTMGSNGTKKNQLKTPRTEVGRGIGQINPRHRQNINKLHLRSSSSSVETQVFVKKIKYADR